MKFTVSCRNVSLTLGMQGYLERKLTDIERIAGAPLVVRVSVERSAHHRHGRVFNLRFLARIRQTTILVEKVTEEFYAGVDLAVAQLRLQIKRAKERRITLHRRQ